MAPAIGAEITRTTHMNTVDQEHTLKRGGEEEEKEERRRGVFSRRTGSSQTSRVSCHRRSDRDKREEKV